MEEVHGQEGGGRAAECGEKEQGRFGNTPMLMASLPFVEAIGEEGQEVGREEVVEQDVVGHRRLRKCVSALMR